MPPLHRYSITVKCGNEEQQQEQRKRDKCVARCGQIRKRTPCLAKRLFLAKKWQIYREFRRFYLRQSLSEYQEVGVTVLVVVFVIVVVVLLCKCCGYAPCYYSQSHQHSSQAQFHRLLLSLCVYASWLFVSVPNGFVKLFTDSLCSIFPAWSFLGWGEIKKLFLWACRDSAGAGFCTAILLFRTKWLWATFKRVSCAENLRKIQMQHAPTLRVASAAFWAESWRIFNEKLEIKLMKMRGNG